MRNKLGINNEYELNILEEKIVRFKMGLLDDRISFNSEMLDTEFLNRIHLFLFSDIYYDGDLKVNLSSIDKKKIDEVLNLLVDIGINFKPSKLNIIINSLKYIWTYQIFQDGNTRTLLAFLKLYISYYNLPLKYDFEKSINYSEKSFNNIKLCEQKQVDNVKLI